MWDDPESHEQLLARALLDGGFGSWGFVRAAPELEAPVVRAILDSGVEHGNALSVFAHALVSSDLGDEALMEGWRKAVQVLRDLHTRYGWGSRQRKAKLHRVAADPALLAATQAACASCEQVPLDLLAVLAIDGSEASEDAFLPHLERARERGDRLLDWLARLRKHATPDTGIARLLDQVDERLEAREAASPALDFAARIGFPGLKTFWVGVMFGSVELSGGVPRFQVHLRIDSRRAEWLSVHVSEVPLDRRMKHSGFTSNGPGRDEHGIGTCTADALPQWLDRTAERLDIAWSHEAYVSSSLRGNKRERFRVWLFREER